MSCTCGGEDAKNEELKLRLRSMLIWDDGRKRFNSLHLKSRDYYKSCEKEEVNPLLMLSCNSDFTLPPQLKVQNIQFSTLIKKS